MAEITNDAYGGATILLSDGLQVRLPGLNPAGREPNIQDIRNLATALLALVKNLDDRLDKLEKKES
jgi:CII-binding regulator of phage lambda lysogenization HflD